MMVMTVNSVGALFQLAYIGLYIAYADKPKKVAGSFTSDFSDADTLAADFTSRDF